VTVPAAISALMDSPDIKVNGFLAAGHVCTVMGFWEYEPLAEKYRIPIVVTGFEPVDLLHGILQCVRQLEAGTFTVGNAYGRSVSRLGNQPAQEVIRRVFAVTDRAWRGIGVLPQSGYRLRDEFAARNQSAEVPAAPAPGVVPANAGGGAARSSSRAGAVPNANRSRRPASLSARWPSIRARSIRGTGRRGLSARGRPSTAGAASEWRKAHAERATATAARRPSSPFSRRLSFLNTPSLSRA